MLTKLFKLFVGDVDEARLLAAALEDEEEEDGSVTAI